MYVCVYILHRLAILKTASSLGILPLPCCVKLIWASAYVLASENNLGILMINICLVCCLLCLTLHRTYDLDSQFDSDNDDALYVEDEQAWLWAGEVPCRLLVLLGMLTICACRRTAAVKSLLTVMAVLQQKLLSEGCAHCKWR